MSPQSKQADPNALSDEQRERYSKLRSELSRIWSQSKVHILPKGFMFQFVNEPDLLMKLAEYISLERIRSPWFRFQITIPPDDGPINMALTADDTQLIKKMAAELESLGARLLT